MNVGHRTRTPFVLFVAIVGLAVAPHRVAAADATLDDARADFASGDYAACLRKSATLISSNAVKSDPAQRYDLLLLRGECLLRIKQRPAAIEAFNAAAAVMKNKRDLDKAASATSLAVLVKASPDLTYKSKQHSDRPGINVVEPSTRPDAMKALFDDLDAAVEPRIGKAMQEKSLVPIQSILQDVWELYAVEFAAKGDATSTATKLEGLGGHARSLIGEELEKIISRLDQLKDLASSPTWVTQVMSYRGLTTPERNELQKVADYLVQIERTAENGRRISRLFGRTGEGWDTLLADCAVARDVAQQTYDRRY